VLAAAAPAGILYKIDASGNATKFKELGESYIWGMALGPKGEIYCATGPNGKLLRLDASGEVKELYKTKQQHLMCLAVDQASGSIYAGTEPDGLIYKIEPDGKASILFDADEAEVHCILLAPDGVLYAGTAQTEGAPPPMRLPGPPGQPASGAAGAPQPTRPGRPPQEGVLPQPRQPTVANSVYMIMPGKGAVRL
jgi:hypothetical protein